jgi:predicted NAD/FAD-binding protein
VKFLKIIKLIKFLRSDDNVRVSIGNEYLDYDQVVLASHADQSLKYFRRSN